MSTPPERPDEVPLPLAAERGASPRPAVRTARWRSVVGVFLLLVAVVVGIGALYWAIGPSSDTARNEFTRTVVQILGGGALLASLYFTYRNLQVNLDSQLENQMENQQANRERERLSREANVTDRFAKAVEQLANDKLEVRLGAIFALERLAKDSERDHATIMELLTAYVRERAPLRDGKEQGQQAGGEAATGLATDIQAVLTVIGRRTRWFGQGESIRLDLSFTDLANANLVAAHLAGADLTRADLTRADLTRARLAGANLGGTFLTGVDLMKADLTGADLVGAHLVGAHLVGADLGGAFLTVADLTRADLTGAHLVGAHLREARFGGADLREADLREADLREAKNLSPDQIKAATNWEHAMYDEDMRIALGLPPQE